MGRETLLVFFAQAHYRSPVDYSDSTLEQASATAAGLREALRNARRYAAADGAGSDTAIRPQADAAFKPFAAYMADDLDTPRALAELHVLARALNTAVAGGGADPAAVGGAADLLVSALDVLGLASLDQEAETSEEALALAVERAAARAAGDYARADELRDEHRGARLQRARHPAGAAGRAPRWLTARDRPPRTDLVYGLQPVREALRGRRRVREVVCTREAAEAMPWIESSGVRMSIAVADRVTALAERPDHQGVVALCDPYPYADAAELLARPDALVVALDGVTDPRNLGAIARSCECLGAHGLVIPRHGSAGVTAVVAKASAGAIEHLPIAQVTNLAELLRRNKRADLWSYAAAEDADSTPDALDLTGGVVLVLGAEGTGIRPLVRQRCDAAVRIPMHGQIGSLNVAVAASLLLYEADRQRRTARRNSQPTLRQPSGERLFVRSDKFASAHLRS